MEHTSTPLPKKRINSIDALRGFALIGIMLWHCMEHFDLMYTPQLDSPFWQQVDNIVFETLAFLFAGKSYAIFSLLFGLSFFIQMDSQADKGVDFRPRFAWRLVILLVLGYLNGLIYMGEFFLIYAILGMVLIPLFKVPAKWLLILAFLLFMQLPALLQFVSLLNNNTPNEPTSLVVLMDQLFEASADVFIHGSWGDVIKFNTWKGQLAKLLWVWNNFRYLQLIGLFIIGMLIGRSGIHKSEEKMVRYSKKVLPYTIIWTVVFYLIVFILPHLGIEGFTLEHGQLLFKSYANLGMMMFYICGFTLLYYNTSVRKVLDKIAPVGRMSVTNYMAQGLIGTIIFYGFGFNCAMTCSYLQCALIGALVATCQVIFCNWWMKRYYYGPVEWAWRGLTWFKRVPLRRN